MAEEKKAEKHVKFLGVEFAPLNIPRERRLQTLGCLKWIGSFLFLGFGMLFLFIYLLFTDLYWIPLGYLCWYFYDKKTPQRGGREVRWFREWKVWEYMRDYFPINLVKTSDLDPTKNYILGCHPHGIMSTGAFCNFATDATDFRKKFPGFRPILLTLVGQFLFPVYRDYIMTTGMCECSKESIEWLLTKEGTGNALVLIIGGANEALEAKEGNFRLCYKQRKGFVKIALRHGVSLVPMYCFGENNIYEQVPNPPGSFVRKMQQFLVQRMGFSMPVLHGRGIFNYTFGILPFRRAITTVVGKPIDIPKVENPGQEEIDKWHEVYGKALVELFEEHKTKYGIKESDHLEFI